MIKDTGALHTSALECSCCCLNTFSANCQLFTIFFCMFQQSWLLSHDLPDILFLTHGSTLQFNLCYCHCNLLQVRFWYHIYGDDVGSLVVYQRTSYIPTLGGIYKLNDFTGNSDYWHPMEITLPDTGTDFQVNKTQGYFICTGKPSIKILG